MRGRDHREAIDRHCLAAAYRLSSGLLLSAAAYWLSSGLPAQPKHSGQPLNRVPCSHHPPQRIYRITAKAA